MKIDSPQILTPGITGSIKLTNIPVSSANTEYLTIDNNGVVYKQTGGGGGTGSSGTSGQSGSSGTSGQSGSSGTSGQSGSSGTSGANGSSGTSGQSGSSGTSGISGTTLTTGSLYPITASWAVNVVNGSGGLTSKSGTISASLFSGSPMKYTVTFIGAFSNNQYGVQITSDDSRIFTIENKLAGSFSINTNSNVAPIGYTYWLATKYGEA